MYISIQVPGSGMGRSCGFAQTVLRTGSAVVDALELVMASRCFPILSLLPTGRQVYSRNHSLERKQPQIKISMSRFYAIPALCLIIGLVYTVVLSCRVAMFVHLGRWKCRACRLSGPEFRLKCRRFCAKARRNQFIEAPRGVVVALFGSPAGFN